MNTDLIETIVLKTLRRKYEACKDDYKLFNGKKHIFVPVGIIQEELGLSAYQQRGILEKLEMKGIIGVKFGQGRQRWICFPNNPEPNTIMRAKIKNSLNKLTTEQLQELLNVIEKCKIN